MHRTTRYPTLGCPTLGYRLFGICALTASSLLWSGDAAAQEMVISPETGEFVMEQVAPSAAKPAANASAAPAPDAAAAPIDSTVFADTTISELVRDGTVAHSAVVDITRSATSAAAAQQQALALAPRMALAHILAQQVPERTAALLQLLDDARIATMVAKVIPSSETRTSTLYKASLTVNFDVAALETLIGKPLKPMNVIKPPPVMAPAAGKAALVLPVWIETSEPKLWEPDNAWRRALNRAALEESRGRLVMPYGDPTDQLALNASKLATLNYADVSQLTARYGTVDALVVQARPVADNSIQIVLTRLGEKDSDQKEELITQDGANREALMRMAASKVAELARAHYQTSRESLRAKVEETHRIRALAPIARASDWASMRQRLIKLPMVMDLMPVDIGSDTVEMDITFKGSAEAFGIALKAANIHVTPQAEKLVLGFYPTNG